MKRIKVLILLFLICLFLGSCSLFGTKTPTTTLTPEQTEQVTPTEPLKTPTPEVVITEIYAKVSSDLYVSLNQNLNKNAIKVYAKYSDNTEKDITSEVSFSSLDTSEAGVKELTITYQGFTTKLNVSVLTPTGVRLDYSNATTVFEVGQTFNISNLIIYNVFGEVEHTANSFNITIKDPDGESINIGHTLIKTGTYTVYIRSNGFSSEYNVEVVNEILDIETPDENLIQLDMPVLSMDSSGLVSWEAVEHASSYKYQIDNEPEQTTTSLSVQLQNGQYVKVWALGDGVNYSNSDFACSETYTALVTYVSIELDTTNVKKIFNEEELNTDNLKVYLVKSDNTKEEVNNDDYDCYLYYGTDSIRNFKQSGTYEVNVIYTGSKQITEKRASYSVEYTTRDFVKFSWANATQETSELVLMNYDNPGSCLDGIVPSGYYVYSFSHKVDEWVEESYGQAGPKAYCKPMANGKTYLVLFDDINLYTIDSVVLTYNEGQTINRSSITTVPLGIPEGMKFSHWNLPTSFTMNSNVYAFPVFVPETMDTSLIMNEEENVYDISANSIDVCYENFVEACPEGYVLESLTLSVGGEVIKTIPYDDSMLGAYFTDLTAETEYEVGAYYSKIQTPVNLRKARQLTYRFHFVGFKVLTTSEVKYRVRMMYNGDCLYRWYFAPNTNVENIDFYYSYQLPIEYDGYTVIGSKTKIGIITENVDLEAEMVPPAGDTCTVVFYDKHYADYVSKKNILKTEVVSMGGCATPPTVEQVYEDGNFRYEFIGWSGSYTNVAGNVFIYPMYEEYVIGNYQGEVSVIVGDTYVFVQGDLLDTDGNVWVCYEYSIYQVSNNQLFVYSYPTELHYTNRRIETGLTPNTKYRIEFSVIEDENYNIELDHQVLEFTTRTGNEKLNYTFNVTSNNSYSYSIANQIVGVDYYVEYVIDREGLKNDYIIVNQYNGVRYKHQDTTYYLNPVSRDYSNDGVYLVYFDPISVTTGHAIIPVMQDVLFEKTEDGYSLYGHIDDPTGILLSSMYLYYKTTDLNYYENEYIFISPGNLNTAFKTELNLIADDGEGTEDKYELSDAYIYYEYIYNGAKIGFRYQLTV